MALFVDRRCVGVVGIQASGKSTFLTSLIHQLRSHNPAAFSLGDGGWRIKHLANSPASKGLPPFPYDRFRVQLHRRHWPDKTRCLMEYRCRLSLTHEKSTRGLMSRFPARSFSPWRSWTAKSNFALPNENVGVKMYVVAAASCTLRQNYIAVPVLVLGASYPIMFIG